MKVFSIYDSKAEAFMTTFYLKKEQLAIREFEAVVNQKGSKINTNPEDFALWYLSDYDETTGIYKQTQPSQLMLAINVIKKDDKLVNNM